MGAITIQERTYNCPVEVTLEIIGGRWKSVVLYHLLSRTRRFGELRKLLPGVTQRMLTLQLRELEADGVVHREVYHEIPPKVEYSLTEFGRSLEPILRSMLAWGEQYHEHRTKLGPRPPSPPSQKNART